MMRIDVAIIGGGIYGSAACYYLSREGIRVAMIEEEAIGAGGATAFSRGIVRVYDPDPVLAALSLAGAYEIRHWEELNYPGMSPFRRTGCLYRVSPDHHEEAVRSIRKLQDNGYCCQLYTPAELRANFPFLKHGSADLAIWEPDSGYGDPRLAAANLAAAAKMQGAVIFERCRAVAIEKHKDGWSIRLPYGRIEAGVLLVAAGAAIRSLVELPVLTRSIGLLYMNRGAKGIEPAAPIVDEIAGTYLRPLENGGYYCGTQIYCQTDLPGDLPPFGQPHLEDALFRLQKLLLKPYIGKPMHGLMGFDAYTENYRPLVGFLSGYENLYIATGFSGRGFKYALALSKQMVIDIGSRLGHDLRFLKGDPSIGSLVKTFVV